LATIREEKAVPAARVADRVHPVAHLSQMVFIQAKAFASAAWSFDAVYRFD